MSRQSKAAQQGATESSFRLRIRPAYVILAACMALFAYKFLQKTQEIQSLSAQRAAAQYQNDRTAQDNARLRQAIREYQTPWYIEDQARSKLDYTNPGEVAVQSLPRSTQALSIRAAPLTPTPRPAPVWKQWWQAFFP